MENNESNKKDEEKVEENENCLNSNISSNQENDSKEIYNYTVYPGNNPEVIVLTMENRSNFNEIKGDENSDLSNIHFIWKPTSFSKKMFNKIREINDKRKLPLIVNHIENFKTIPTKPGLYKSLKGYYNCHNYAVQNKYTIHDSMPTSYFIVIGSQDDELNIFMNRYKEIASKNLIEERMPLKHCLQNLWLFKPSNWNQGRGIEVFRTLQELNVIMSTKPEKSYWVIQKYIEKPLLYKGRKFDFRIWVLLTDSLEIFFYKFGYIRTSSENFTLDNNQNFVHLTNNCLQKHGDSYGIHEEGNTISLIDFKQFIETEYMNYHINFDRDVIPRMKDLIIDSILSSRSEIISRRRNCQFELLGYDFMLDEDFRVWIIEVNTNPYIGVPNEYIAGVIPNMIGNMINIVLNHTYPPYTLNPLKDDNDFELIYCGKVSLFHSGSLNLRTPFNINNVYPIVQFKPSNYKCSVKNTSNINFPSIISYQTFIYNCNNLQVPKESNPSPNFSRSIQRNRNDTLIRHEEPIQSTTKIEG